MKKQNKELTESDLGLLHIARSALQHIGMFKLLDAKDINVSKYGDANRMEVEMRIRYYVKGFGGPINEIGLTFSMQRRQLGWRLIPRSRVVWSVLNVSIGTITDGLLFHPFTGRDRLMYYKIESLLGRREYITSEMLCI
jgi:hypothetical protein